MLRDKPAVVVSGIVKMGAGQTTIAIPSNSLPRLANTTLDLTTLGIVPGEWVFVGGDATANKFAGATNNGFKRVRSISADYIEFDKSESAMVVEVGGTLAIWLYLGTVLKNEVGTLIKRKSYHLERTLGAPDATAPSSVQAEYLVGAIASELSINVPSAEKLTVDVSFIATQHLPKRAGTPLSKDSAATAPAIKEADAFNTSSDFSRIKLAKVVDGNPSPKPLFAFAQSITVTLTNNLSPNKAVGFLGSFEVTAGTFQVGGTLQAYFSDIEAVEAVVNNDDVTLDMIAVKGAAGKKKGIALDIPLLALGDGRLNVEQDSPITIPLGMEAGSGAAIDSGLNHTLMLIFFEALPNAADV